MKGSCAIELQGEGFDVDAEEPAGDTADIGGRGYGSGRDVILRGNFFDCEGLSVEAAHACGHDSFDYEERVAVQHGVAVDTGPRGVL